MFDQLNDHFLVPPPKKKVWTLIRKVLMWTFWHHIKGHGHKKSTQGVLLGSFRLSPFKLKDHKMSLGEVFRLYIKRTLAT